MKLIISFRVYIIYCNNLCSLQTINSSDIKCIKELGSGAYSTVFYGKCQGSDVVIKKLRLTRDIKDTIDETLLVNFLNFYFMYLSVTEYPFSITTDGV